MISPANTNIIVSLQESELMLSVGVDIFSLFWGFDVHPTLIIKVDIIKKVSCFIALSNKLKKGSFLIGFPFLVSYKSLSYLPVVCFA